MFESGEEVGPSMIELPAVSGEAKVTKKVNKAAESYDKYFGNGKERSSCTSELGTLMDSILLNEKNIEANRNSVKLRTKRPPPSNIFGDKENNGVTESLGKGKRRLIKPRACRNLINLDSDEESDENQTKTQDPREPDNENVNHCVLETRETSAFRHPGGADEIEESENWNHSAVFKQP